MGKCESSQRTAFSSNDKHLFTDSNGANHILAFFCVIKLIHVVDRVDIGLFFNIPANLSSKLSVPNLPGWLKHSQPRSLTLVLPQVHIILWTYDDVSSRHSVHIDIQSNLFTFDGRSDGVAQVYLSDFLIWSRKYCTKLSFSPDLCKLLDVLHVLFVWFGIPENDAEFHSVWLLECENQCAVWKITPFVVGPDWSAVNVRASSNGQTQAISFPSQISDSFGVRDSEIFQVIAFAIEELDNGSFLFILKGTSSNSHNGTRWIPFDFTQNHWGVNCNWIVILVIFH